MEVHMADIGLVRKTQDGRYYTSDNAPGVTIKDALHFEQAFRVLPNSAIASASGYPTIAEFLTREAVLGFKPVQVTQTFIITLKEP
jgi:hypothetical protein